MKVEFKTDKNIVLLANIYGSVSRWEEVHGKYDRPPLFKELMEDDTYEQLLIEAVKTDELDDFLENNPKYNSVLEYYQSLPEMKEKTKIAEEYCKDINEFWDNNLQVTRYFYQNILKIDYEDVDKEILIYVSNPESCIGSYLGNDKVLWGHENGVADPWYNFVYLHHEILHSVMPRPADETKDNLNHAIIELATDNELWSELSGESKFGEGHFYLKSEREYLYPYWLLYLGLNKQQIAERNLHDSVLINDLEPDQQLANMNIFQFEQYVYNLENIKSK